jgi:2-polyprenyl-6-methoxyphenol hydroxylase-like FAD-dependent oxidoreductase
MNLPQSTTCCVVGCGPAGAVLGWLLARAGVDVVVLEKHADFRRDFRGDTVHSSTIQTMDDLGVADEFLRLPHHRETKVRVVTDEGERVLDDLSVLKNKYPFIAYMPQWELLDFVTAQARRHPSFRLVMRAEAYGLLVEDGAVTGVRYRHGGREHVLRSVLTVAADGRRSAVRAASGLPSRSFGAPIDLLWFRLPRADSDPDHSFGRLSRAQMMAMIHRGDYWQAAYVVEKGGVDRWRARDIGEFRARLADLLPWLGDRTGAIRSWDDVYALEVRLDRMDRWYRPGFLAIGDAAHAMSVIGGVGINLAVQDAVAAARILAPPLLRGRAPVRRLARVQRRRMPPTVLTQRLQQAIQDRFLSPYLDARAGTGTPLVRRLAARVPWLRRKKAAVVAVGFRSERAHRLPVAAPAAAAARPRLDRR